MESNDFHERVAAALAPLKLLVDGKGRPEHARSEPRSIHVEDGRTGDEWHAWLLREDMQRLISAKELLAWRVEDAQRGARAAASLDLYSTSKEIPCINDAFEVIAYVKAGVDMLSGYMRKIHSECGQEIAYLRDVLLLEKFISHRNCSTAQRKCVVKYTSLTGATIGGKWQKQTHERMCADMERLLSENGWTDTVARYSVAHVFSAAAACVVAPASPTKISGRKRLQAATRDTCFRAQVQGAGSSLSSLLDTVDETGAETYSSAVKCDERAIDRIDLDASVFLPHLWALGFADLWRTDIMYCAEDLVANTASTPSYALLSSDSEDDVVDVADGSRDDTARFSVSSAIAVALRDSQNAPNHGKGVHLLEHEAGSLLFASPLGCETQPPLPFLRARVEHLRRQLPLYVCTVVKGSRLVVPLTKDAMTCVEKVYLNRSSATLSTADTDPPWLAISVSVSARGSSLKAQETSHCWACGMTNARLVLLQRRASQ